MAPLDPQTSTCPGSASDLVVFQRTTGYKHYAINVGDGYIVHVTSGEGSDSRAVADGIAGHICSANPNIAVIKKEKYRYCYKKGDNVYAEEHKKQPLPTWEIVERALSRVGEKGYNLFRKNCEHFARWCCYGEEKSTQVDTLKWIGAGVLGVLGVLGAMAVGLMFALTGSKEEDSEENSEEDRSEED